MTDSLRDALEAQVEIWEGYTSDNPDVAAGFELAAGKLKELLAAHPVEPAPVASRERMIEVLGGSELAAATVDHLLAAGVFRDEAECGAVDRSGQRRCVFTPGHHEAENWTSHGDRGGWTWNDQPAKVTCVCLNDETGTEVSRFCKIHGG